MRYKNLIAWWLRCATFVCVTSFLVDVARANDEELYEFDIPSQEIESALSSLAEKTSAMLLFPYETVQLEKSNPVNGRCTLNDALSIMLQGTSLAGDLTEGGVITISQKDSTVDKSEMRTSTASTFSESQIANTVLSVCGASDIAAQQEALDAQSYQVELPIKDETLIQDEPQLDEVIVTGSFIKRKSYNEAGSPIDVLTRSNLDADAPTGRLVDILRFLPSNSGTGAGIVPGGDGGPQEGRLGGGTVDIRGLGGNATLVLLNGQRSTAFPLSVDGRVDVNSLVPGIFLERVEVLKDGASGVYGSDAVAGVVNFFTRDKFEGFEFRADGRGSIGATVDPFDHHNQTLGLLLGTSAWDKVHIVAGIEYFDQDNLVFGEVEQVPVFDVLGASTFGNPGSFRVPIRDEFGQLQFSETGALLDDRVADPACQAVIDANISADPNFSQTATSLDAAGNLCRTTFPNQPFLLDEKRINGRFQTNWEITDSLEFVQAFSYAASETIDVFQATTPVLNFPTVPGENPGNPFRAVDGNGNPIFAQDANGDGVADRNPAGGVILDPNGIAFNEDVLFRGRPFSSTNLGLASPKQEIETSRFEFGFKGKLGEWDWSVNWNTARQELLRRGPDSISSELQAALNGQGGDAGDVFLNPFGSALLDPDFSIDPALVRDIQVILFDRHVSRSTTFDAVIAGDLAHMSAGPLSAAIGVQVRNETLSQDFDQLKTIREVSFFGNGDVDFTAKERVTAAFVEAGIPVLNSEAGTLDISLAGRVESISGGEGSFNPKFSFQYSNELLDLKGSYATSFLSPSLFQTGGITSQFDLVTDPITGQSEQVSALILGNRDLNDQESTSYSFGLTFRPFDNLSIETSYWNFEFENLVAAPTTQSILNADPLGPLIERNSSGTISVINRPFFNAGSIESDGIDFAVDYDFGDTVYGNFSAQTQGVFVNSYDVQEQLGAEIIDGVGSDNNANIGSAIAQWRNNSRLNWYRGPHSSVITARYFSDIDRIRGADSGVAEAQLTFDAQYSYSVDRPFVGNDANIIFTIGARNIFNDEPNIVLINDNQFFVGTFQDPSGRVVYASLKVGF